MPSPQEVRSPPSLLDPLFVARRSGGDAVHGVRFSTGWGQGGGEPDAMNAVATRGLVATKDGGHDACVGQA